MSPTQERKLEEKIDQLEKKLDFVIHHYIKVDIEDDWIDDPKIVAYLDKLADETKGERLLSTAEVFES